MSGDPSLGILVPITLIEVGSAVQDGAVTGAVKVPADRTVVQNTRLLYPRRDAAYQLGISVRGLDYLIKNKKLAFRKIGGRVLIHWKELQRFAASNHYEPVVPTMEAA